MDIRRRGTPFDARWLLLGIYPITLGFMLFYQAGSPIRPFIFSGPCLLIYVISAAILRMLLEVRRSPRARTEGLTAYLKEFALGLSHGGFFIVLATFAGVAAYSVWHALAT